MFCATCNLEYPDHLNFCRRCGQTLVRALGERVTESVCCTRCGARVVHGEKFCQHCGTRVANVAQETVVGVCENCNSYWRSGWQYCKTCGVNSEQALQLNAAVSNQPAAAKRTTAETEISAERSECPHCSAVTQAFSLFCDHCGMRLSSEEKSAEEKKNPTKPEAEKPAVQAEVVKAGEDSLSRLDDLLLDDPLSLPARAADATNGKGASARLPNQATRNEASRPPLRLVEKPRETEAFTHTSQIGTIPIVDMEAPPPVPQSWRAAIAPVTETNSHELPKPVKATTQPLSLIVGETGLSRRPMWHVPLLLGGVLLGSFLLVGVWRKAQSAKPVATNTSNSVSKPTASVNNPTIAPSGMVYVTGGKFQMGRNEGTTSERPLRVLEVKPFFLDRTEVTNQQYLAFVEATARAVPSHWRGGKPSPNEANLPVVNVAWEDARDFATWANKRLPTEEEWEFAARSTDGRLYPWGNGWEASFANTAESQAGKIVEVGRNLAGASPYGVVDLCGNVWEWTSSELRAYATQELLEEGVRVIRGGAFDSPKEYATTTYRGAVKTGKPYPKTGFRCAKDLP